ncbi:MAG: cytochrome c oxidase subunit 3 [Acetobacteraceae bacterium]|nr:cytochrome c oxidase subunit 3 [Acetobacteraceae bacterium]
MSEFVAPRAHAEFQYASAEHQRDSALAGMWLFLATEILFFGALFYLWVLLRRWHPLGFHLATADTDLLIGSVNTVIISTAGMVFFWGVQQAKRGQNRPVLLAALASGGLGLVFIGLKLFEWSEDVGKGKWPGQVFQAHGDDIGGQHLFWLLYYAGTALHVVHMTIGVLLVAWIAWRARKGEFKPNFYYPVVAVGLYWSFVDVVWINLYPFIYLLGR